VTHTKLNTPLPSSQIDIDSELVVKQEILEGTSDTVMQLSNGCLCCTVRDDLITALNSLWARRSEFDHIIIETTGLANPAPIISSFYMDANLPDRVRLDGVVTVVDAKHVTRHLDVDKGETIVNEAVEQIAYADRLLLNKVRPEVVVTAQSYTVWTGCGLRAAHTDRHSARLHAAPQDPTSHNRK
jgi:G3E family GTPase